MISENLLERLKDDFDLAALSWGLAAGSGELIYVSGDPVELLQPPGDPTRHHEVVLLTPGTYKFIDPIVGIDRMLNLVEELQSAAMDLLRKPFPETLEGHVLTVAVGSDANLWWMEGDVAFARVGSLPDRELARSALGAS